MIKTKIEFKEKGGSEYKELLKRLKSMKRSRNAHVTIGLHEGAGEYDDGVDVVEVGFWQEFGTDKIPARSYFRSTMVENEGLINEWRTELLGDVIDGQKTVEAALSALGFRVRELIKNKINSDIPPANAPSTIAQKKADGVAPRTLVHTGLLLRSIEFKVVA